jgi:predicted dehydrogenase
MKHEAIKIGIVGIGYWNNIALEAANYFRDFHIERVWSRSMERSTALATELSTISKKSCHVMKDQFDLEGLDLVVIALPPTIAQTVLERAIDLEIPSLVEKPLSLNFSDISKLKNKAEQKSVRVAVNLQARFVPEMYELRNLALSGKYGSVKEVDIHILGNNGHTASPSLHSWLHDLQSGGGVRGISGPHAAEFAIAILGDGKSVFSKVWTEVLERKDSAGVLKNCTADDNTIVISEHNTGRLSTLRLGTTSRKAEETWSVRCQNATLRYTADKKLVVVDNFGKFTELPCDRTEVLRSVHLENNHELLQCSEKSFPALVLLKLFAENSVGQRSEILPDLNVLEKCMTLLST